MLVFRGVSKCITPTTIFGMKILPLATFMVTTPPKINISHEKWWLEDYILSFQNMVPSYWTFVHFLGCTSSYIRSFSDLNFQWFGGFFIHPYFFGFQNFGGLDEKDPKPKPHSPVIIWGSERLESPGIFMYFADLNVRSFFRTPESSKSQGTKILNPGRDQLSFHLLLCTRWRGAKMCEVKWNHVEGVLPEIRPFPLMHVC